MRTCVIGGGGFIGSYLVSELLRSGRDVLVLGRRPEKPLSLAPEVVYHSGDFGNRAFLRESIESCDEIVDLAYSTVPKTSYTDPLFDLQSNLQPFVGLLEVAQQHQRLRRLIVVSSGGTVYGSVDRIPIVEEDRTSPISPYGITKLTIERYSLMYHCVQNIPATVVRPANAYGLGQKPFTGQGFIATAMGHILQRKPVIVFGENGTVRDYIHVRDVASGILLALDHGKPGEVYNIGSAIGRSNKDVLDAIAPLAERDGFAVTVSHQASRSFDVPANVLSHAKLTAQTQWQPLISFEEGLAEMWEDFLRTVQRSP